MTQRIAVVGAGHLGRIHAKLLQQVEGAELVAIADPSPQARATATELFDVPVVASHQEILDRIDAAVIASPTPFHFTIASELLEAGKHLLVEKPLATTADEAAALARLAKRQRRTLQVGHVERFNPAWVAAADVVAKPKYVEAIRASRFPGRCLDVGVVMDLMIHDIDLILSLTEAPLVDCQASGLALVTDNEDLVEARLTFACGLVANLKASRVSPTPARQMQVYSEHGFAEIDFGGPALQLIRPATALAERSFDLATAADNPLGFADTLFTDFLPVDAPEIEPRNAILDELHDFVISIRSAMDPTVNGVAGARAVEVAESVIEAVDRRHWAAGEELSQQGPMATPREGIEAASRRLRTQQRAA